MFSQIIFNNNDYSLFYEQLVEMHHNVYVAAFSLKFTQHKIGHAMPKPNKKLFLQENIHYERKIHTF